MPRLAAVEFPPGQNLGQAEDGATQRAVLMDALGVFEQSRVPGEIVHLPYRWPGKWQPEKSRAPIAAYLRRRPWLLQKLFSRDV